ncbi:MAG: 23S rRNA (guanosine(2251)-2'-O)-methyltransferase RlmB [Haliangiales bacterium]
MTARRFVYGIGPVEELLARRAREISVLYVNPARKARARHSDPVAALAAEAKRRRVAVEERDRAGLDALVGGAVGQRVAHQGVVAVVGEFAYAELEDLTARAARAGQPALIVALDGVSDPHNLGAVVRSAYLLGVHGLIIPRDRAAGVTPAVTKVSAGATEHVAIAQVTNLARALESLKEAGLWRAALAAGPDARPIAELDATLPMCLVLGAEGSGIRPLIQRHCDFLCALPMYAEGVGSFNVSVAAGIALYDLVRRRRPPA